MKRLGREFIGTEVSVATGISRNICENILYSFTKFGDCEEEYDELLAEYKELTAREKEIFGEEMFIVGDDADKLNTDWIELRIRMEDFMNSISPEMSHFGSHEGNNSLLGFWLDETEFTNKQYDNIIRRKSYLRLRGLFELLTKEEELDDFQAIRIVERVHAFVDSQRGYGTKQKADNALESLRLLKEMVYNIRESVVIPEYCVKDVSFEFGNNLAYPDRFCGTRYKQKPRRSGERNIRITAGVELTDTTNIFDSKFMNLDDVVVQFKCYRKPSYGAEYMIQIDLPHCKIITHPDPDVTDYVEVMQNLEFYPIRTIGATESDEMSVTLQCTETGSYEETGTLKSGSVSGFIAAEARSINLTGLPSNSMTVKKIRAWINNDPTGDVNVEAILRFYWKDTFNVGDLIYETILNLTYTKTNGIAVGETTDTADSIGGLEKGDLVRFLDPATADTPEYARLTEQPNGTTINFNPALYAHTNNTSIVKVFEFDGAIPLVDVDASNEIHLEIETIQAPIGSTSVYVEVVSVPT